MLPVKKAIVYAALLIAFGICAVFWDLIIRPLASLFRREWTAYDYEVLGWKLERKARFVEALKAYEKGLKLEPHNKTIRTRHDSLIAYLEETNNGPDY